MATETEEIVYCSSCGSPERLEIDSYWGPTPADVPGTEAGWSRYWTKCYKCGGKQFYDHPLPDLVKPVEPEFVEQAVEGPTQDLRALADNTTTLEGPTQPT